MTCEDLNNEIDGDHVEERDGPFEYEVKATVTYRISADNEEEAKNIARDNATGCNVEHISLESVQQID